MLEMYALPIPSPSSFNLPLVFILKKTLLVFSTQALEFLHLWQRFEELGFKSEDIRRELIVHGNNENEVLNVLMAKS